MSTTDLSAEAWAKADVPLSPEERFREVAAILAAGLLRLRAPACGAVTLEVAGNRPQLAAAAQTCPAQHAAPGKGEESGRNPLAFPRT